MSDAGMGFVHNSQALCPSQRAQPTWGCLGHFAGTLCVCFWEECSSARPELCAAGLPGLPGSTMLCGALKTLGQDSTAGHSPHLGPQHSPQPQDAPCSLPGPSCIPPLLHCGLKAALRLLPAPLTHTRMQQCCSHDKASSSELLMYTRKHTFNIQHLDRQ